MLTSDTLSIKFHIILVIILMTIQVFYISIISFKSLPMFMIHVLFIIIALSLYTCFMPTFFKEVDTGKDCMYSRVLLLYATVISICTILYEPSRVAVMTQMRPTISV